MSVSMGSGICKMFPLLRGDLRFQHTCVSMCRRSGLAGFYIVGSRARPYCYWAYGSCVLYVFDYRRFLLDYDGLGLRESLWNPNKRAGKHKMPVTTKQKIWQTTIQHSTSIVANRMLLGRSTRLTTFANSSDRDNFFWTIKTLGSVDYRICSDFFAVGCPAF